MPMYLITSIILGIFIYLSLAWTSPLDTGRKRREHYYSNATANHFVSKNTSGILKTLGENYDKVRHSSKFISNSKGNLLHAQKWRNPNLVPKAVLMFIHGYSSGTLFNYALLCRCFAAKGYLVISLDGEGHGLSDGVHSSIIDFDSYVNDFWEYFSMIAKKYKVEGKKCFLMSLSMGGSVAAHILLKQNSLKEKLFDGAIFSSPMIKISKEVTPNKVFIFFASILARYFPLRKWVPRKTKPEFFNKCFETRNLMANYKIFYNERVRLGTAFSLLNASKRIGDRLGEISVPVIVLHGLDDKVTCPVAAKEFFDAVSSKEKVWKGFKGERHGIFFDGKAEEVFLCVADWLDSKIR